MPVKKSNPPQWAIACLGVLFEHDFRDPYFSKESVTVALAINIDPKAMKIGLQTLIIQRKSKRK